MKQTNRLQFLLDPQRLCLCTSFCLKWCLHWVQGSRMVLPGIANVGFDLAIHFLHQHLVFSNSSSFSWILLSISCLTWAKSSCARITCTFNFHLAKDYRSYKIHIQGPGLSNCPWIHFIETSLIYNSDTLSSSWSRAAKIMNNHISEHLVLLLLEGGLCLFQGALQLLLLNLKTPPLMKMKLVMILIVMMMLRILMNRMLPSTVSNFWYDLFIKLMYGATTLAKLVKQVFDLFGKVLVLPLHLQQHHCQLLLLSFAVVDLTLQKPHLLDHRNHSLYHYSRAIDMTTNHWLHIHHHHHHHHRIEANRIKLLVDLLPGSSESENLGVVVPDQRENDEKLSR